MKKDKNEKNQSKYPLLKVIGAAAALFAVCAAVSFPLKTVSYTVTSEKITDSLRIAQISDLHSCAYGKNMDTLISAIDEQSPDIIVLTGDIYDDKEDNKNTRQLLKKIAKCYPCYYVAGNHEFRTPMWESFKQEAQGFGVTVMEGDSISVGDITLCGAAMSADRSVSWEDSVKQCAEKTEGFSVLLWHFPEDIDYVRSFGCFDLVLSGHAHGGQWRIPGIVNGLFSPGQGLFPEYAGGRYDFDDSTMIVSRGLSRTKNLVPRIFNNPELVIIDLKPGK